MCGLRNTLKRREVFLHVKQKADIVCLQETHSSSKNNDEILWQNEFGGIVKMSHGETNSRGIMIGFKKNFAVQILGSHRDQAGRYIIVQFEVNLTPYVLVNVYAPNEDNPSFFVEIFHVLERFEGKRIIIGDFNLTLDPKLDRTTSKLRSVNNDKVAGIILDYVEDTFLTDPWRDRNEGIARFTYRKRKPHYVASRIDFVLTEQNVARQIKDIDIVYGYKSDHSAVYLEISDNIVMRGRGYWKLNNRLLYEKDYLDRINACIKSCEGDMLELNANEKWELIKLQCINESIEYAKKRASARKLILAQLEEKILEMQHAESDNQLLIKTQKDYNELVQDQTRGAMFRSKAKWYNEGEKPTKYFLNLEKSRSSVKAMSTLLKDDGTEIIEMTQILEEQAKFYQSLYRSDQSTVFEYINDNQVK